MTTFTGQKIVLRPHRESDAEALDAATKDPILRKMTGTQGDISLEMAKGYIARFAGADDRVGWVITHPETDEPLGEVVILKIDPDNRSAAFRIAMFNVEHLNKGYGTEAMRFAVDYAFDTLKLHRLELDVFDYNAWAIHVYEKIGFKREGLLRDTMLWEGEYASTIIMAILEDDWRALR